MLPTTTLQYEQVRDALIEGWRLANATRLVSFGYAAIFVGGGLAIIATLLWLGWTPFVVAAAGAFMLVGPAVLAGFFGIAAAHEAGLKPGFSAIVQGYRDADQGIWVIALVCGLLFLIFVTDAAILYAYMVGGEAISFGHSLSALAPSGRFLVWSQVSGAVVALLLYAVSAFSVPLLCERRATLVAAVVSSVRIVLGNLAIAIFWGIFLSTVIIGSTLLLPVLPVTLPWLAYASRALYRRVLPMAR